MISKKKKRQALELYLDDMPITQIAEKIDVSRNTVYKWRDKGILIDADKTWEEYRDERKNMAKAYADGEPLEVGTMESEDFWEEEKTKLRSAMENFTDELEAGEVDMNVGDYQALYKTLMKMENRGEELQRLNKRFKQKAYAAMIDIVGAEKAQAIKDKIKEIELTLMQEFDPEQANAMLDSADNIDV